MDTVELIIILGIVGSVASVIGLLISAPNHKSRLVYVAYGIFISILAVGAVTFQHRVSDAERRIVEMQRIEREAAQLLSGFDFTTSGSMAGFMLAAMSFLEKHKDRLPDSYYRAVVLCENSECLKTKNAEGLTSMEHFRNMQDASTALRYLVQGISQSGG
ncbi:hypothetical protein D3C87_1674310 [compost metagenome]